MIHSILLLIHAFWGGVVHNGVCNVYDCLNDNYAVCEKWVYAGNGYGVVCLESNGEELISSQITKDEFIIFFVESGWNDNLIDQAFLAFSWESGMIPARIGDVSGSDDDIDHQIESGQASLGICQINIPYHRERISNLGYTIHDMLSPVPALTVCKSIFDENKELHGDGWLAWYAVRELRKHYDFDAIGR